MPRRRQVASSSNSASKVRNENSFVTLSLLSKDLSVLQNEKFPKNRTILRHDPVTARAISRLSHGVARLTASPNPDIKHRSFRSGHAKFTDDSEAIAHCPAESVSGSCINSSCLAPGSKRRWQPELDISMELEQTNPYLQSNSTFHLDQNRTNPPISINALNLHTKFNSPVSFSSSSLYRSMSSDNLDYGARYSSESSMLSVTESSDNTESDYSSHEHDADVEDEVHSDDHHKFRHSTKLSKRKIIIDKNLHEIARKPSSTICGGDSSDGLSVCIKMPRLSSTHLHCTNINLLDDTSLNARGIANSVFSARHIRKTCRKIRLGKMSESIPSSSPCIGYLQDKHCMEYSHSSVSSNDDSSCSKSSKDFNVNEPKRSHSCETKMKKHSSNVKQCNKTPQKIIDQSSFIDQKLYSHYKNKKHGTLFVDKPPLDGIDSELDDLLSSTWPLLTNEAKSEYIESMVRSYSKRCGQKSDQKSANNSSFTKFQTKSHNVINFLPSQPDLIEENDHSRQNVTVETSNRMPVPPWIQGDRRVELSCSNESVKLEEFKHKESKHPGIGNWQANIPVASPIAEKNIGHRMLRKMGWLPGCGLGLTAQGITTPVGCEETSLECSSSNDSHPIDQSLAK